MRLWHYLRHKIDPIWPVMPEASYRVAGRTLVLRPVKRGDIATMAELLATAFAEERVAAKSDTIDPAYFAQVTNANEIRNTVLICLDDEIIGFSMIGVCGSNIRLQREATIKYMYVVPDHRSLRIIKQVISYLYEVGRALECAQLNWGFDTGKEVERKRKLAAFLGFEFQSDIYTKTVQGAGDAQGAAQGIASLGMTSFHGFRRYFKGSSAAYIILSIVSFIGFRRMRMPQGDFFETGQRDGRESYILASRRINEEEAMPFVEVEACHRPNRDELAQLERWACAQECAYIRIDTMPSGAPDAVTVAGLLEWGAVVFGCSFAKQIEASDQALMTIEVWN